MSSKREDAPKEQSIICGKIVPGPKYKPKPLVGYKDHCTSKYRSPAYSFGSRRFPDPICRSPGPKYKLEYPHGIGYSLGLPSKRNWVSESPGPKYDIRAGPKGPVYSIKGRTDTRSTDCNPGPYGVPPIRDAPAFTMGIPLADLRRHIGPGPAHTPSNLNAYKPKYPVYSFGQDLHRKLLCDSPGPKYDPTTIHFKRAPIYSFGTRHSPCAPPYIVEGDDRC
ncbi:ciliary microtubule associated protein 1A [Prorops nasuta]|uniref:ciliary microtubule associated protein 1A n=1 Tax=Prorops nasuta TaxID=863751 RepID=UPI0034CED442